MMAMEALPRMPWFRMRVVSSHPEPPLSGSLLTTHHFQVLLGFWTALGVACLTLLSLRRKCGCLPLQCQHPSSFLATLHWPQGAADSGNLVFLTGAEQSAGHRLTCEKVIRPHLGARRPPVGSSFSQPVVGMRSGEGASSFMVCSGFWATVLEV